MLDDFLVRAGLAALGVALAAAPLGCFVVWRRMAYFGDATAHAAMLGVALSLALGASVVLGALVSSLAMAAAVAGLSGRGRSADTMLGVAAHSALAVGLVAAALAGGVRVDLAAYLLGDILSVGRWDLAVIWGGGAMVWGLLAWRWEALLAATLSPELARAAGVDPAREGLVLALALALVVAVAIKVVGVLLIAGLLVIPPAAARAFATTPEAMAAWACVLAAAAAGAGLAGSALLDAPAGPAIVCAAAILFCASSAWRASRGGV